MERDVSRVQSETEDASRRVMAGIGGNPKKHGREEDEGDEEDEEDA